MYDIPQLPHLPAVLTVTGPFPERGAILSPDVFYYVSSFLLVRCPEIGAEESGMFREKIDEFTGIDLTVTVSVDEGLDGSLSRTPQGELFPCFPDGVNHFQRPECRGFLVRFPVPVSVTEDRCARFAAFTVKVESNDVIAIINERHVPITILPDVAKGINPEGREESHPVCFVVPRGAVCLEKGFKECGAVVSGM